MKIFQQNNKNIPSEIEDPISKEWFSQSIDFLHWNEPRTFIECNERISNILKRMKDGTGKHLWTFKSITLNNNENSFGNVGSFLGYKVKIVEDAEFRLRTELPDGRVFVSEELNIFRIVTHPESKNNAVQ